MLQCNLWGKGKGRKESPRYVSVLNERVASPRLANARPILTKEKKREKTCEFVKLKLKRKVN